MSKKGNHGIICRMEGEKTVRDIPIFTTEQGIASLELSQIPGKGCAYVRLRDVREGKLVPFLEECESFCTNAGAERIFASGEGLEAVLPEQAVIWEMEGPIQPASGASLILVTEKTVESWRQRYNEAMQPVDHARLLAWTDRSRILESGGAYFVCGEEGPLGLGWAEGQKLLALAAFLPGQGARVLKTLMGLVPGNKLTLEVASTNLRALRLYERFGFQKIKVVDRWYSTESLHLSRKNT